MSIKSTLFSNYQVFDRAIGGISGTGGQNVAFFTKLAKFHVNVANLFPVNLKTENYVADKKSSYTRILTVKKCECGKRMNLQLAMADPERAVKAVSRI